MPDCCYSWPWRAPPRPIGSDIALTSQSLASSGASLPPGGRRRRSTRHRTSGRQGQERNISCVSVVPPLLILCPSCAAALTASVLWSWSRRRNRPSCASWNGRCPQCLSASVVCSEASARASRVSCSADGRAAPIAAPTTRAAASSTADAHLPTPRAVSPSDARRRTHLPTRDGARHPPATRRHRAPRATAAPLAAAVVSWAGTL